MVKIIENYTLHEQIGQGEYGKVFRGIDSRNKKEVAVKVINVKKFKQYPKLEQCTLNQIQVLSKIQSPHIVKFIEILKTANNFYFFYEFCNQGTLEDVIKAKGTLSQSQSLEYLSQILEAFKILNSKNIMHRDLKPSNILVSDGIIKIADFGFCKSLDSHRDLAQTMLGSPIYMAPEVLKGEIYTIKADIWSLGVVIYEMLYGFCPFEERSIARLINLLDKQQVNFNQQINKISPAFEDLLKKMLIKDHFKRIGWKQIFQYKINGVPIMKSSIIQSKQDKERERYTVQTHYTSPLQQLKEAKNFNNLVDRPVSRTSFDFNYQDYSGNKPIQLSNNSNQGNQPTSIFKKNTQQASKTLSPTPTPSISNKQNIGLATQSVTVASKSKQAKNRLKSFLKLASQVIDLNYCPQISILLCIKIYQTLQKQITKMDELNISTQQKLALADTIKQFQEQSTKGQRINISGPLLNYYVKALQISHKQGFQSTNQNKDIIIHCLSLLDLNDFSTKQKNIQYQSYSKEKLISELYQKIIRNVI